jgi:hypothetical protein
VVARLALILLVVYCVLILIVLVNMLIAIVSETYTDVKQTESLQMLRNKASVIDEIESILPEACRRELNGQLLQPYVHVLVPQQASGRLLNGKYSQRHGQKDSEYKLKKLKGLVKQGLSEQRAGEGKVERLEAAVVGLGQQQAAAQQQSAVQQQMQVLTGRLDMVAGEVAQMRELLVTLVALQQQQQQQQAGV